MTPINGSYVLQAKLTSLAGPVLCIAGTKDGKLACGGIGGTRIWLMPELVSVVCPSVAGQHGATTAAIWITREDDPDDVLVYGTQSGHVIIWKEANNRTLDSCNPTNVAFEEVVCAQTPRPGEITGLCFEPTTNRLAVCNRNSVVQVFAFTGNISLEGVFSTAIQNHIPKGVAFLGVGNSHSVLSFGMYDGKIKILNGSTGKEDSVIETGGMIGNARLDSKRGILCIDDLSRGAALYRLDPRARVRTYSVPVEKSVRPRQVGFAEDCSLIVVGSDHGKVYVFDRRRGDVTEELFVGRGVWLQTVLAIDILEIPYIIAAKSSEDGGGGEIYLWKKSKATRKLWNWKSRLTQMVLIVASLGFICQNFGFWHVLLRLLVKMVNILVWLAATKDESGMGGLNDQVVLLY